MSDSDKSLDILIKTKADLAGAKAAEAQLEQDIVKAKALGEAYDDLESRLKNIRESMAAGQGTEAPLEETKAADNERTVKSPHTSATEDRERKPPSNQSNATEVGGDESGQVAARAETGGKLGWFKAGIEGLRLAIEAMPALFGTTKGTVASPAEKADAISLADPPPGQENRMEGRVQPAAQKKDIAAAVAPSPQDGPPPLLSSKPEEAVASVIARTVDQTPVADYQGENEAIGQVAESHAQAVQFSGEKMKAALELNTQITVSLFNRMLELVDQQNRKLGEVDRKIAELGGQIKSLKNL